MSPCRRERFEADLSHLDKALAFVEASVGRPFMNGEKGADLLVAVEEAITNISRHAYEGGGLVEVTVRTEPGSVAVTLVDGGQAFDPRSVPPPDLDAGPEERAVGGLGVHLMKSLVDDVLYRREDEKNVLTLIMSTDDRSGPKQSNEER